MTLDWTAIGLLRRTLAAYSTCQTYRDCGRVEVSPGTGREPTRELFFTLDFIRPNHLRFDAGGLAGNGQQTLEVATVMWDGETAKGHLRECQAQLPSVGSALSWASRVDGPATEYLVHLLFGDAFPHAEEPHARYAGLRDWDGGCCHKLEMPSPAGHAHYELWIDEDTHWLRGLREYRQARRNGRSLGGPPTRTAFEFHPALDVPVDESVFGEDDAESEEGVGLSPSRLERYLERG